jgi:hypothetical protein
MSLDNGENPKGRYFVNYETARASVFNILCELASSASTVNSDTNNWEH